MFSFGERRLVKQKFDLHRMFLNRSYVLMLVNYVHTLCVSRCLMDCTHAGNSMLSYNASNQDSTKHDLSNIWLWPISKTRVGAVKYSFHTTGTQKELTISALMDFVVTVTQFVWLWVAFMIFVSVRKCNLVSQKKTFTDVRKRRKCIIDVGLT